MNKEIVFNGAIYCKDLTCRELDSRLQDEIFSKIGRAIKNQVEIIFGPKLHRRLCGEALLGNHSHTIAGISCRVSYDVPPYVYIVYLKHDYEDQMDAMTAWFNPDIKKNLNVAFGTAPLYIDMSKAIKKVIFNPPATIIFWKDGSKTVVKCDGEAFDPEKGMAMAISRKVLGDSYEYYNIFEKWCKKYKEPKSMPTPQEVAAKYMTPPTVSDFREELRMAAEEVKRYAKIEPGDSDAD